MWIDDEEDGLQIGGDNGEDDEEVGEVDGQEDDADEGDAEGHGRKNANEEDERQGQEVRPSRGAARFQALRNENKSLAERLSKYERDLEAVKSQAQRPAEPDPRLEADRLAMMTPEERMEYRFMQSQEQHKRELARIQVQMWDTNDRQAFNTTTSSNPVAAKYADQVEQLHREQLQKGQPIDRQTILAYVVGKAALASGGKAAKTQRAAGQKRIEQQRAAPLNGRGNVAADRRGGKTLEDRLSDVYI